MLHSIIWLSHCAAVNKATEEYRRMIKLIPYIISSYSFEQLVSKLLSKYYRSVLLFIICEKRASDEDYRS